MKLQPDQWIHALATAISAILGIKMYRTEMKRDQQRLRRELDLLTKTLRNERERR